MVEWTPKIDATVATRVMDAGGIIVGKAGKMSLAPPKPGRYIWKLSLLIHKYQRAKMPVSRVFR